MRTWEKKPACIIYHHTLLVNFNSAPHLAFLTNLFYIYNDLELCGAAEDLLMSFSRINYYLFKSILYISLFLFIGGCSPSLRYDHVIKHKSKDPVTFFYNKLQIHDLLICDDGLHPAVEPYDFLCEFLREKPESVDMIFMETISIKAQSAIDSFMNSDTKDTLLLAPVFQESFHYFWPYETCLKVLSTVWDINQTLPQENKIQVIGVDQAIYWEGLQSRDDYNIFQSSLSARDNFMYQTILKHMHYFNSGKKGIFMTNTRHAYKCIRNKDGQPFWNAGTFFHEWHPGKTYALRFHNMILHITALREAGENASTEGMDQLEYTWARMDNGEWDKAFARNSNAPLALPFKNNILFNHFVILLNKPIEV